MSLLFDKTLTIMLMIPSFRPSQESKIDGEITNWKTYLVNSKREFFERYDRKPNPSHVTLADFELLRTVGTGWYGRVILVRHRTGNTFHALKVFSKDSIVELDQLHHVISERKIIQACDFRFITELQYYFTDNTNLYFVMPFIVGGELFSLMRKLGRLSENSARFYAAQLIMVLEYLHNVGVVYRDIKPENILLDKDGYIRVTDFGFAKLLQGERTFTMCGTPEYFAPEMIKNVGYGDSVDWWALGVLIYEMCCGRTPFNRSAANVNRDDGVFRDISSGVFAVPLYFSDDLKDVVLSLLQVEIWKRTRGAKLRQMPWFRPINWLSLINKKMKAPHVPAYSDNDYDASNYDRYEETPLITSTRNKYGELFRDF